MPENNNIEQKATAEEIIENIKAMKKSTKRESKAIKHADTNMDINSSNSQEVLKFESSTSAEDTNSATREGEGVKAVNEATNSASIKSEQKPTLFMLNNNAPQDVKASQASDREIEKYYHENIQSRSYGTIGITLGVVALLCSIVLIIALASGLDAATTSGFLLWTFNFILLPVVGIGGSVIFALISAILGIVAIIKAHKRIISWVAFALGLVILAYVVIMAGIYMFT